MSGSTAGDPAASRPWRADALWLGAGTLIFLAQQVSNRLLGEAALQDFVRRAVFLGTTASLCVMALHFRRIVGAWLVAAGIALNLVPIAAHGGLMPIAIETIQDSGSFTNITEADIGKPIGRSKDIILRRKDIRFAPLSDKYVVTIPVYGPNIYSAGDFVLFAGVVLAVVQLVALGAPAPKPRPAKASPPNERSNGPTTGDESVIRS
ncbi:MAG: DUF5317 family protein [Chloroflexi bacterium]|nr:DUF5317 family protein [Chloroflexota bacterium]